MARKKPAGKADLEADTRVSVRGLESRELLTIEPESREWVAGPEGSKKPPRGTIVRLRPPPDATDESLSLLRSFYEAAGAERVITLPRPRAVTLPAAAMKAEKPTGAREAVEELVAESASKKKPELEALCQKIMGEVGL
jgi:hypothetical protein